MTLLKVERIGFNVPDGGNLHVVDGVAPQYLRVGRYGVGFGPLRLTPFEDSTAVIDGLRYTTPEDDGWFPLAASAGAVGAALHHDRHDEPIDPESTQASRRQVLAATGAGLLALTTAGIASAQEDDGPYQVAEFELTASNRGLNIAVDPLVADYLPDKHTFYVSVNDNSIGRFQAGEESLTLNPGVEGTVTLESDDALSFVAKIIARVTADDEIEYEFQPAAVSNGSEYQSFADAAVGEEIVLSDQPILVDPIDTAEPEATIVTMNDETIPHADDGDSLLGEWYVQDGRQLVYVAGEDAPDTSLVNIQVNVGRLASFRARYL
ncbi:hypothetical protein [Natrialba asiatica]|uniref:Uncharacterized protein n=1 Tax=Natrialba asiatica (strain ATCC 700177 / DSM 12278 / JCM 9576 / FERM P-10747 / NBRC 102637 / 172P1) TaxID=29540 RepID=M0AF33_NATA1|nr:hypothetical protein [Natrialba asiatica]ELY97144.1 hypothetical protein C481_21186 [Natrialba asiatica DSM 12278]